MAWVLQSGPLHINKIPVLPRKWEPNMQLLDINIANVPVWIELKGIWN